MLGVREAEIPVLAELHRSPAVRLVGVYDPDPAAIGHEMAEILGIAHGHEPEFLEVIAQAAQVVLSQDRERIHDEVQELQRRHVSLIGLHEALELYGEPGWPPRRGTRPKRSEEGVWQDFEDAIRWLDRALDREEVLRGLLSLLILAVDADSGSIQLINHATKELYIAYAEGLSDHTIRSSRRRLGEGISGRVALSRRGEVIEGQPTDPSERDRSDIQSAVCVPLVEGENVLGVASVSRDRGSRSFGEADLAVVTRMAQRITPVLTRLLEIQSYHERALVDDLEKGLDRLLQMELSLEESLGLTRDLLEDLSGAQTCQLILLNAKEGLALRVVSGGGAGAPPRIARDVDPNSGILGQVLLTNEIVILEERVRPAGSAHSHRYSTLYVPLGVPESFAVVVAEFEGLAALSYFQRNLSAVSAVLTNRLGVLIGREESRLRMHRWQELAAQLGRIAALPEEAHPQAVCDAFVEAVGARFCGVWTGGEASPTASAAVEDLTPRQWQPLWERFRREVEGEEGEIRRSGTLAPGEAVRSWLVAGSRGGPLLIALDAVPRSLLEDGSFGEDHQDAAALLLAALQGSEAAPSPKTATAELSPHTTGVSLESDSYTTNRLLLREALEREVQRAQRYHFGFSLTCFQLEMPPEARDFLQRLKSVVESTARATDCVLFIAPARFAVLAPEEARGQRRLARRYQRVLQRFLKEEIGREELQITVGDARYPHDADTPDEILSRAQAPLGPAPE